MNNLKELYEKMSHSLSELYEYDSYNPYQELCYKLDHSIQDLCEYFGIKRLRIDIGPFKMGEMIQIEQDESGTWLSNLDNTEYFDISDCTIDPKELFL